MHSTTSLYRVAMRAPSILRSLGKDSVRPFAAAGTVRFQSGSSLSSELEELSSSIEKLEAETSFAETSSSVRNPSAAVHIPRAASSNGSGNRLQTVSGRAFKDGHYYNPSTLSYQSITEKPSRTARPLLGPSRKEAEAQDLLHISQLKPGKPSLHDDSYKNGAILSYYITEMGKIMPRSATGLTRKSQRNIGKAIRRARAMGLLPVMSRGGPRSSGAGWK